MNSECYKCNAACCRNIIIELNPLQANVFRDQILLDGSDAVVISSSNNHDRRVSYILHLSQEGCPFLSRSGRKLNLCSIHQDRVKRPEECFNFQPSCDRCVDIIAANGAGRHQGDALQIRQKRRRFRV